MVRHQPRERRGVAAQDAADQVRVVSRSRPDTLLSAATSHGARDGSTRDAAGGGAVPAVTPRRQRGYLGITEETMTRITRCLVATGALLAALPACYQDDANNPSGGKPMVQVLLTDAPFPYADVASVIVHVVRVEAAALFDTSGTSDPWITIATPDRDFDLLELQQGTSTLVGEGAIDAGEYDAVRLTINTGLSRIRFKDNTIATVHWPSDSSAELTLIAAVQGTLPVPQSGAAIVIDFDVGRSFLYNETDRSFDFIPWLRAVNAAATGSIAGLVTRDDGGSPVPVVDATVTVYSGNPSYPPTWFVASSGHTGADGRYRIAYLLAGSYIVRIELPGASALEPSQHVDVAVAVGAETAHAVTLHAAGAAGITIQGVLEIDASQSTQLEAIVTDDQGALVPNPVVGWSSLNTSVATVSGAGAIGTVTGHAPGLATIVATSNGRMNSVNLRVRGDSI